MTPVEMSNAEIVVLNSLSFWKTVRDAASSSYNRKEGETVDESSQVAYVIHANICHDLVLSAQSIHSFEHGVWKI